MRKEFILGRAILKTKVSHPGWLFSWCYYNHPVMTSLMQKKQPFFSFFPFLGKRNNVASIFLDKGCHFISFSVLSLFSLSSKPIYKAPDTRSRNCLSFLMQKSMLAALPSPAHLRGFSEPNTASTFLAGTCSPEFPCFHPAVAGSRKPRLMRAQRLHCTS